MIALPFLLIRPAEEAGMKFPNVEHLDSYEPEEYPHWHVFLAMQLGQPMPFASAHWENAKVIAAIPEDEIKSLTAADIIARGFAVGFSK